MKYLPITIDFETTDKDPLTAHPVECALFTEAGHQDCFFIKPPIGIPPETSAIHHIIDADVDNAEDWEAGQLHINATIANMLKYAEADTALLIAHNAKYEQTILRNTKIEAPHAWVCTYKVSMVEYPDAPTHSNEGLRYWLGLGERGRSVKQATHSALHDCKITMLLYQEMLNHKSLEDMILITKQPVQYSKMPFGKHRGEPMNQVPSSYLQWMIKQGDMEEDIKACARQQLAGRK